MAVTTTGSLPDRLDITARAGSPLDLLIPVLQSDGTGADLTGWTAKAQIRDSTAPGASLLHEFTVSIGAEGVTLAATADQTAGWAAWFRKPWDLVITDSSGVPAPVVAGWITAYSRITH